MNLTQAFTTGLFVGATSAFTVSAVIAWTPRAVRKFLDWRASRWTDADESEIRSFEHYVGGFNTVTQELEPVPAPAPVEWVRPDEEEGALIPRWRPATPPSSLPFRGPSPLHIKDWISWNYGDYLAFWSTRDHKQDGGRHRLV